MNRLVPSLVLVAAAAWLVSAGPSSDAPDELVRQGNEAFAAGNPEAAVKLYAAAEERAADPGLVAFNEGVALAAKEEFREAEVRFLRALDDRDAPPDRRARAFYNRGVCLIHRGRDAAAFRTAVECFERCLGVGTGDAALEADARHNLELAKLLWGKARLREKTPPKASDPPPESRPEPEPTGADPDTGSGADTGTGPANGGMIPQPIAGHAPRGQNPLATPQQAPGAGSLPVHLDDAPQPLTPDVARDRLKQITDRLRDDRRRNAELTAGPERPDVPDW